MVYPTQLNRRTRSQKLGPKPLVAASLTMILAALMVDFNHIKTWLPTTHSISQASSSCTTVINNDSQLSRAQLAQLLTIPEQDAKSRVQQVVSAPYCQLPTLKVRAGVEAEREAYPLAFDPGTTLVILYENNEYAGYRFSFE